MPKIGRTERFTVTIAPVEFEARVQYQPNWDERCPYIVFINDIEYARLETRGQAEELMVNVARTTSKMRAVQVVGSQYKYPVQPEQDESPERAAKAALNAMSEAMSIYN